MEFAISEHLLKKFLSMLLLIIPRILSAITKQFSFMKTVIFVMLGLLCACCKAQTDEEKIEIGNIVDEFRFQQLQLIPVKANKAFLNNTHNSADYLTLSQAVKEGKVLITERSSEDAIVNFQQPSSLQDTPQVQQNIGGSGASVNSLFIENKSADTVLILGGEVVEGGNQDRTIAQDLILPPNSGKIDLSVFCVEHGRWSGNDKTFQVADASFAPARVRKAAMNEADQQKVWDEVASKLSENKATSATQALTVLKEHADYTKVQQEYVNSLSELFNDDDSVIGVIAIAGGEIIGAELFASHDLFVRYYPNVLQSWAGEAIGVEEGSLDEGAVREYFKKKVEVQVREEGLIGGRGRRVVHVSVF